MFSRAPRAGGTLFHDPHKARPLTLLTTGSRARARMGGGGPLRGALRSMEGPRVPLLPGGTRRTHVLEMAPNSYRRQEGGGDSNAEMRRI